MPEGFTVDVRSNADKVAADFLAGAREMRDLAVMRALNKAVDQGKVATARSVRDDGGYKIKVSTIKAQIKVKKASQGSLRAAIIAKGKPIPLINYGARQTSKGVTVSVQKGRRLIPGAFIATMQGGHVGVFVHDTRKQQVHKKVRGSWHQLPIRELYGPSVPDGMANKDVQAAVMTYIDANFPRILKHESEWLRRKVGSR